MRGGGGGTQTGEAGGERTDGCEAMVDGGRARRARASNPERNFWSPGRSRMSFLMKLTSRGLRISRLRNGLATMGASCAPRVSCF